MDDYIPKSSYQRSYDETLSQASHKEFWPTIKKGPDHLKVKTWLNILWSHVYYHPQLIVSATFSL